MWFAGGETVWAPMREKIVSGRESLGMMGTVIASKAVVANWWRSHRMI